MKTTSWNYTPQRNGEVFTEPSATMPGMALGPKQILERFQSGRPMGHIPGYYEFSGDRTGLVKTLPDISRYDYFDQVEYFNALEKELNTLKSSILKGSTKSLENVLKEKIEAIQHKIDHPELYDKDGNLLPVIDTP